MASEGVSVLVLLGVAISFMALVVGVLGLVPKWVPFLEDHEREFRWLMFLIGGGLVVRFVLEYLGLWPWA